LYDSAGEHEQSSFKDRISQLVICDLHFVVQVGGSHLTPLGGKSEEFPCVLGLRGSWVNMEDQICDEAPLSKLIQSNEQPSIVQVGESRVDLVCGCYLHLGYESGGVQYKYRKVLV